MKYTIEQVKKISKKDLKSIIDDARSFVKHHPIVKEKFKEYDVSIDEIDTVPIIFKDIKVSATTEQGIIYLSYDLLCDGNFEKDYSYLAHELVHYLQQTATDNGTDPHDEYLKNPDEQEGFNTQVRFIEEEYGEEEAEKYVEHLLDYHEVDSKDKNKIKEKLIEAGIRLENKYLK